MAKTYCLAIDVKSPHIDGGLGYMLTFHAKDSKTSPEKTEGFDAWADAVRTAVRDAGDQPFNPDPYTRKVAIAELMYEIEKINSAHPFVIEGTATRPAVEVQSSNPHDKRIVVNFTGEDGQFDVVEKRSRQYIPGRIGEDGRVTVLDSKETTFPFLPAQSGGMAPPAQKPGNHLHWRP
ncbi:MAG: hypothetical protein H3C49_00420 [Alphaproteobacteria bacterium]|nr:hypothetical protein [Alphaproteobacteria bacterium]HRI76471.1 hypothetical protein [Alphaproteobacteria bacterium]